MIINTLEELFELVKYKDFQVASITKKCYDWQEITYWQIYLYLPGGKNVFNGIFFESNSQIVLDYLRIKQI